MELLDTDKILESFKGEGKSFEELKHEVINNEDIKKENIKKEKEAFKIKKEPILKELDLILKEVKEERKDLSLLFSCDNNDNNLSGYDFETLIENISFSKPVNDFFQVLLNYEGYEFEADDALDIESKELRDKKISINKELVCIALISDITMEILMDSFIRLRNKCLTNKGRKALEGFAEKEFLEYKDLRKVIISSLENMEIDKEIFNGIKSYLECYKKTITYRMPISCMPFILYALIYTYNTVDTTIAHNDYKIIKEKVLCLNNPDRRMEPNPNKDIYIKESMSKFLYMQKCLSEEFLDVSPKKVNQSLSILWFNEITSLFDVELAKRRYLEEFYKKADTKFDAKIMNCGELILGISNAGGLLLKYVLYEIIPSSMYEDRSVWKILERISEQLKKFIENIIKKNIDKVNNNISFDEYVYQNFIEFNPYKSLISNINSFAEEYEKDKKKCHSYFYSYNTIYKQKFPKGKNEYEFRSY